jgi:hypothetical protein
VRKILDTTLKWARAAGIELSIDDDDLVLEASAPPPAAVLDALSLHKADVVRMLRPSGDGWSAQDWQVAFDKRAGLAQFNDALSRAEAEAQAFACCVVEWLDRNPEQSPPGRCHGCGCRDHTHDPLLPSAWRAPAMPGCIRAAGLPGMRAEKSRLSQR